MAEYIERSAAIRALTLHDCDSADAKVAILELPTADVAPIVHGRWGENGIGIIICSECGNGYNLIARYANYCPNCGAKMDEEDK